MGSIERQYDSSFARDGAKIGDELKIRLPNEYTVTTGRTLQVQDTEESSVTLQVSTQKHVGMNFSAKDLTLDIDNFSKRFIEPAMARLAASIEADALSMYKDVYNVVDQDTTAWSLNTILKGGQALTDNLAPRDDNRMALLTTDAMVRTVDALKGLFQSSDEIAKQYRSGLMGYAAGFKFMENTLLMDHTTGTAAKTTGYLVNGASQTGSTLTVDTGSNTFLKGDVITIAGVNRVHPETKVDTGQLQQFVVTADSGGSATSLSISPAIVTTGGRQNVSAAPADNAAIVKIAAGASESIMTNLAYHKEAFAFATADLVMPNGVDFASRQVVDGISMRVVRQYDINNDSMPCRIDILYGFKAIRPQLAARLHADG